MHAPAGPVAGELLPLTHYIRSVKAILLRDSSLWEQLPDLGAMALFFLAGLVGPT